MASRYHWLTPGFDISGAVPATLQTLNVALPAGAIVKRFQLRNNRLSMRNEGLDRSYVYNLTMHQLIQFTSGPNTGRVIFQSLRRIPFIATAMVVTAVPVIDWYASAGDNELGVNQRCSYGLGSGAAANLQLQLFITSDPNTYPGTIQGAWTVQFAVLYYL